MQETAPAPTSPSRHAYSSTPPALLRALLLNPHSRHAPHLKVPRWEGQIR